MTPSQRRDQTSPRHDLMAAAVMGAIANAPLTISVVGWTQHWNAYTNLTLTLASAIWWVTLWVGWRNA